MRYAIDQISMQLYQMLIVYQIFGTQVIWFISH